MVNSGTKKTALVIGGSMAGMLAARVLSDHFDEVLILEHDSYPQVTAPRGGVPQARHLHALLPQGHSVLEQLFPGITEQWLASGADLLDVARDFAWRMPAGWGIRYSSDLKMLAASRPLMDQMVRERIGNTPRVSVMEGVFVDGLRVAEGAKRVSGVHATRLGSARRLELEADLVVDASGRMSQAPSWLREIGYEAPRETAVNAHLGYASRLYSRRDSNSRNWRALFLQASPPDQPRAGIAFPIEGNRWIVTMSGGGGDFAPTDEAGFVEFARSLPNRQIYDLITSSEPMSPIVGYRRTENRWRHYEHTRSLPDGFVVIGDAACAFNPVYGQGITVAAMSALELGRSLAKGGNIPRRFHRRQARLITAPWRLATGEDVRFRNVEGGASGRIERIMHWYVHHLMAAATHDAIARDGLLRVFGMVSKPHLLFRFSVLWRVLKEALLSRDRSVGDAPVWGPTTTDPVRPARLVGGQVPEKFHARSMG